MEPSPAIASDLHDDATKISLDGRVLAYGIATTCFSRTNGARFRRTRAVLVGLQPQRIGKTRVSLSSAKLASTEAGVESNAGQRSDDEIASANHGAGTAERIRRTAKQLQGDRVSVRVSPAVHSALWVCGPKILTSRILIRALHLLARCCLSSGPAG